MALKVLCNNQVLYENLTLIATRVSKLNRDETCKYYVNYLLKTFKEYDDLGYY